MDESRSSTIGEPIRVLRLLRELHRRGYQRLRLHCGWSPNGMAWRYGIAPVEEFEPDGLRMRAEHYPGRAFRSSRGDGTPFDVGGRKRAPTDEHADAFLRRFGDVAREGRGPDRAYAVWLDALLSRCEPDGVPIMYSDDVDAKESGILIEGDDEPFRLPPPPPETAGRRGARPT